ncbi:MAG: Gp15 family bacteriophage protein [Clostridium sp.]
MKIVKHRCDKDIKESKGTGKSATQIYSFEYDDDYLYSAFLDQYGVDLQDVEYLHWWKFKSMFKALKEDNEIVKIMGYRAITIDNKMSRDKRHFIEI